MQAEQVSQTSDFEIAVQKVLIHEGGLVNNPSDPGGITNFGISLRYLVALIQQQPGLLPLYDSNHDGIIDAQDIIDLSKNQAIQIYKTQWWDRYRYGEINNNSVAGKVFDLAVNVGAPRANTFLQEACQAITVCNGLIEDGILGAISLNFINQINSSQLLQTFLSIAKNYYVALANAHPQLEQFLNGWLNRLADV
jgi:lysozyme family protein